MRKVRFTRGLAVIAAVVLVLLGGPVYAAGITSPIDAVETTIQKCLQPDPDQVVRCDLLGTSVGAPSPEGEPCVPIPIIGVEFVDRFGVRSPVPGLDKGVVYHYGDVDTEIERIAAPDGFHPVSASDDELAAFGFPPRPSDPDARAAWNEQFASYTGPGPQGLCVASGVSHANVNSANWSGMLNGGGPWTGVNGAVIVPNYGTTCGNNAMSDAWVGLGGKNTARLAQTGINSTGTTNTAYAWFEMLNATYDTGEVRLSLTAKPGKYASFWAGYSTRSDGRKQFYFDVAYNGTYSDLTVVTWKGHNMTEFYDGSSSEFINERPTVGGAYAPLKRYNSYSWVDTWTFDANAHKAGSIASDSYFMRNGAGTELSGPDAGFASPTTFTNTWHACS